ncbi:hypothetical protein G9C98_004729 [Cotesia typhae]|uniref:Mediator of RNA polymerase II transcription subunit 13 n=1 Tax=Cotesia typhae TaxID=2053667 RepID=A0A8J5R2U8_9HYME|nr:hypothetical protein G9C98_004729 [Cotesia typhae]
MTHPSHQTNGASLEDCHTNFFALTDLCGIKWRKFVWGEMAGGSVGTPLEDPVLSSFSRCLASDILCVWRRVAATPAATGTGAIFDMGIAPSPAPPPLSLSAAKELWIFWYGEEPDLSGLVSPELIGSQSEQGSWESGLSYECRSLLFKALHNLIERCLLSRDFVRLGKWFVQPYDGFEKHHCNSSHLSFSFAFFVHGDSTVCASVDVRQHPAVRYLTRACLQRTQASQADAKVILAPYGLAGTLTGQSSRIDSQFLDEWKHFYPINNNNIEPGLPPLVEVLVGGVRMRYPSCYVLVTDMDDVPIELPPSPPYSPAAANYDYLNYIQGESKPSTEMPERVWAECILGSSSLSTSKTNESSVELGTWTFIDPTQKSSCMCSKKREVENASVTGAQPPGVGRIWLPLKIRGRELIKVDEGLSYLSIDALPFRGMLLPPLFLLMPPGALLEDEPPLSWLYDYSTQEAWLNHPVKRFKPSSPVTSLHRRASNLYAITNSPTNHPQITKFEIKQEPGVMLGDCTRSGERRNGDREGEDTERIREEGERNRNDPYEFDVAGDDDNGSGDHGVVGADGLRRPRDEPPNSGSLFTSEGLQVSYKDLDQIFDNSDPDTSSDETNLNQLQVQTPPGSNKSGGMHEETRLDITKQSNRGVGVLRPEEVVKMFPTPPSLEHPVPSPCQMNDAPIDQTELSASQRSHRHAPDIYPNMGSPPEEPVTDWSYVFKPPTVFKLVGSSKYAPLTNLPSQFLPPITLPSHCVYRPSWQCNSSNNSNSNNSSDKNSPHSASSSKSADNTQDQQEQSQNQDQPQTLQPPQPPSQPSLPPPQQHQQLAIAHQPCPSSPNPNNVTNHYRTAAGRPPPPPYDQPSPATSTSSYLNKNINSIDADTPGPIRAPESNSLVVNILLGDTVLNIFRDHNFDSCSLCVCNYGQKVVGNIKGADAVYLAGAWANSSALFQDEEQLRCNCGFSAVVYRRLATQAGLFYEDELEIAGIAEDPSEKKKSSLLAVVSGGESKPGSEEIDVITPSKLIENNAVERTAKSVGVHRWAFIKARGPQCNGDILRMMRTLQPLLQDAVQKKCTTRMWEAPYTVTGPLTWRQFHRLAGRGTEDRCEPQPIPALVVGYDRDWLSLSPYALSYWEKLLLEPYAGPRDVAYVVLAPDSEPVINKVKYFFRELSTTYEICQLGKHTPITKACRDGIIRVGKSSSQKWSKQPLIDDWFKLLGDNQLGEQLRLYAQVCSNRLAPYLTQVIQDRSLLDPDSNNKQQSQHSHHHQQSQSQSPSVPPSESMPTTPDGSTITVKAEPVGDSEAAPSETPSSNTTPNANSTMGNVTPAIPPSSPSNSIAGNATSAINPVAINIKTEPGTSSNMSAASINAANTSTSSSSTGSNTSTTSTTATIGPDEEEVEPPSIVVYIVEPFSVGGPENSDRRRLAILALLRAYSAAINAMPENLRSNINVQLISLESIIELGRARERRKIQDEMRSLALNVFLQGRRLLNHNSTVKSLTGFGTAAAADIFLKNKNSEKFSNDMQELNKAPYRLYTPAYVLAPLRSKSEAPESFGIAGPEECAVMYLSYCLSEDQSRLLAVATDDRGEIFETAAINIDVPNRKRRKRVSARRIGLQKLMDFIVGVMSQGVQPWRLVVGRVGRIGHGELKSWGWLLSRKALLKASKQLKELCKQCALLYPSAAPCVLSACLVSLEPDSTLRLMADQFTPDSRFSQASVNCQLSTPQDVTCTHILVFPTSATTQSSQTAFQEQHINGPELGDDELFSALNDDMNEGMEGMGDLGDIFNAWPEQSAGGGQSPCNSPHRPESPLGGDGGGFVSTAPIGRMPSWFWSTCPHLEGVCPAFLKNALHLHSPAIQQNSDDILQQHSALTAHPLDSQYTTDVLRYVLEGYNALSWLAVDANTKDRLSCLPVHVQALMQLYHTAAALV